MQERARGACQLRVVLTSAAVTPRNVFRIKMEKEKKKKKINWGKICLNNENVLKKLS